MEFLNVKKRCEQNGMDIKSMLFRIQSIENILRALRGALEKQTQMQRHNHDRWVQTGRIASEVSDFIKRTVNMHSEMAKISEENILLESNTRLMNLEIQNSNKLAKSMIV